MNIQLALTNLGLSATKNFGASSGTSSMLGSGNEILSYSPVDAKPIASTGTVSKSEYDAVVLQAQKGFQEWRSWPAPKRGEVVRQLGLKLREHKEDLGALVSYEMGKSLQEGLGEVQEMIDICDFAVGLSRQLHGLTIASERPAHRMMEQWHPYQLFLAINFR
mgnify:CR=1 FL=1